MFCESNNSFVGLTSKAEVYSFDLRHTSVNLIEMFEPSTNFNSYKFFTIVASKNYYYEVERSCYVSP